MKKFSETYLKKLHIGNITADSNVLMAPLAGYTCYPFRMMCRELGAGPDVRVPDVREHVLEHLGDALAQWRGGGFRSVWPAICRLDFLKGRELSVLRVENDAAPVKGVCDGIGPDGALLVAGIPVYAGEAHVMV